MKRDSIPIILNTLAVKNNNFLLNDSRCKRKAMKIHLDLAGGHPLKVMLELGEEAPALT